MPIVEKKNLHGVATGFARLSINYSFIFVRYINDLITPTKSYGMYQRWINCRLPRRMQNKNHRRVSSWQLMSSRILVFCAFWLITLWKHLSVSCKSMQIVWVWAIRWDSSGLRLLTFCELPSYTYFHLFNFFQRKYRLVKLLVCSLTNLRLLRP